MKGKECLGIIMMITVLSKTPHTRILERSQRTLAVQGPYFQKHWPRFDHWKTFKMILSVAHEKMKRYRKGFEAET